MLNLTNLLGNLALMALTLTISLRPLAQVFPKIYFLKKLLSKRRLIGNTSALLFIFHFLTLFPYFPFTADPRDRIFYGLLAAPIMMILFLTGNDFAVRLLKRKWKYLHLLIHPLFLLVLTHKGFPSALLLFAFVYGLRFLAYKKITLNSPLML